MCGSREPSAPRTVGSAGRRGGDDFASSGAGKGGFEGSAGNFGEAPGARRLVEAEALMAHGRSTGYANRFAGPRDALVGELSALAGLRDAVGGWTHEADRDVLARAQTNNSNCPGGQGRGGARAPCRSLATALGSVTTLRTFIRPPYLEQTVTSTANARARRLDQLSGYGVPVASRRPSGRAVRESRESCSGASSCGEDGMRRARR